MSTQAAKTIRTALKNELGITSRKVSVRANNYSLGSSVDVTIRDADVDVAKVTEIAERSQVVRRCEATGDILGGGNTFVSVRWSEEARAELAARFVEVVNDAVAELDREIAEGEGRTSTLIPIEGTKVWIGQGANGYGYQLWNGDRHGMNVDSAQSAAFHVGHYESERATKAPEVSPMEAWIQREGER